MADAGWYPDAQDPNAQHYFDGQNWTGHRRPNPDVDVAAAPAEETVRRADLPGFEPNAPAATPGRPWQEQPQQADPQPAAQPWDQQPAQPWEQPTAQPWNQAGQQTGTQQWGRPDQQSGTQQPGAQQSGTQQWGQPGQQPGGAAPWQHGQQGDWTPTPSAPKARRRKPLIIVGVAVVAVVAGLVTWLVLPGDDAPSITYGGKEVASASATLSSADKALSSAVRSRKGASNDDTRCYFSRPSKPAAGAKKSDVDKALRCGPVLFVDGSKSDAYLRVPLTDRADGSKVTLTAPDDFTDIEPSALGDDVDLVRPDGKSAPDGVGGLSVPQPPAAEKDVITTAALSDTSTVKKVGTVMVGKFAKVTLTAAGEVSRYGSGADARSAPSGQKLIAFQLEYGTGDVDNSNDDGAKLVVDGRTGRDIPTASGSNYVIAAVPTSGTATIVLADGGYRQTLALPAGTPGSGNIAVLRRANRTGYVGSTQNVPIELSQGGRKASATFRATASFVFLDFWAPGNTAIHASNVNKAILTVRLNYTDEGKTYGFDPKMVRLRIGNTYVAARNIASAGKILNVFEVPASFTAGSLEIQGSTKVGKITVRVKTPKAFIVRVR